MVGVDTNVLVRFLTRDDPVQAGRARRAIQRMAQEEIACRVSTVVLCELVWVLRTALGFRKEQILGTIESLFDAAEFSIEDRDTVREAVALYREGAGDFSDYLIGLRNRRAGCRDTLTFDQSLAGSELFTVL